MIDLSGILQLATAAWDIFRNSTMYPFNMVIRSITIILVINKNSHNVIEVVLCLYSQTLSDNNRTTTSNIVFILPYVIAHISLTKSFGHTLFSHTIKQHC